MIYHSSRVSHSFGAKAIIDTAEDLSRVTLDTICLTAMGYRLNSFYRVRAICATQ